MSTTDATSVAGETTEQRGGTPGFAVLTVSDTRNATDDRSGDLLERRIADAGHRLAARCLLPDDAGAIVEQLRRWIASEEVQVIVTTGGTGITGRDVTPEAVRAVLTKELPGFGELFRAISFRKIGLAAVQSRALGGVAGGTYIFALPGSPSAVADGWDELLRPLFAAESEQCNLADLLPRLVE